MKSNFITVLGQIPSKANNYEVTEHGLVKGKVVRDYEFSAILQIKALWKHGTIDERFTLIVDVYHRSDRFDLDNSLKTFLDVLQYAKVIKNDNMCYEIKATKHIDEKNPRVCFAIETAQNTLF